MLKGELIDQEGEKEAKVIQELRVTNNPEELQAICTALSTAGSWYALPVLYARFADYQGEPIGTCISNTILSIKDKLTWNEDFKDQFVSPSFWKLKWKGGHGRFVSFVSLISGEIKTTQEQEILGDKIIKEIGYDPSPYDDFRTMKLSISDWDVGNDLKDVLSEIRSKKALNELLDQMELPKDLESITASTFVSCRNDYLITRLGLADKFSFYLTLFDSAIHLNDSP